MKNITSTIKVAALSIASLAISASGQAQCKTSAYQTESCSEYKKAETWDTGLQGRFITLGKHCEGKTRYGYHVSYVAPHSPAYWQEIQVGDILVTVGKHYLSQKSWIYYTKQFATKGSLKMSYMRHGKTYKTQLEIKSAEEEDSFDSYEADFEDDEDA